MRRFTVAASFVALLGYAGGAMAADLKGGNYDAVATGVPSVKWEVGSRVWFSTGSTEYSIYTGNWAGYVPGEHLSKLNHEDLSAVSGEVFFRGDFRGGLFIKGNIGAGNIGGGSLDDEDYTYTGYGSPNPYPVGTKYSDTYSEQDGGKLRYFDIDLGYTFYQSGGSYTANPRARLGAFVGYHHWNEKVNAYGVLCNADDVATNHSNCPWTGEVVIPYSTKVISNDVTWSGVRIGLNGDVAITERLKLSAEAAYFFANMENNDTHWLRTDRAGPTKDSGDGDGIQLEAILSYDVTKAFSLGVGGRYWRATANDTTQTQYHNTAQGVVAIDVPQKLESDRYGVFLQGSYKLGTDDAPLK